MPKAETPATDASRYLTALAKRIAAVHLAETAPRAILLTGSAAEGVSDAFSDLDVIAYCDRLPTPGQLAAARDALGASEARPLTGEQEEDAYLEAYRLQGVECQVGHLTMAGWEREMASVLDAFTPGTPVEKALSGLLAGVPLHGGDLIATWQAKAADYPEGLARATVAHHLRFFPLWLVGERWQARDATIFYHQSLVETSLNLLAVLAGLNRRYFSSFQFKRLRRFAAALPLAPERLADRLDEVFALDPVAAGLAMERLVAETVGLVEAHMPEVDTAPARRHLGKRPRPWRIEDESCTSARTVMG